MSQCSQDCTENETIHYYDQQKYESAQGLSTDTINWNSRDDSLAAHDSLAEGWIDENDYKVATKSCRPPTVARRGNHIMESCSSQTCQKHGTYFLKAKCICASTFWITQ
jgi:hypothetical protein